MPQTKRILHLRPAMARVPLAEVLRSGLGALLGIGLAALMVKLIGRPDLGLMLIAPFGASAVLIFAAPNSPLAQPWSAVVGNTLSAMAGLVALQLVDAPVMGAALAVGLAIMLMRLGRALHPPGGAVALTLALSPGLGHDPGWLFALVTAPVGTGFLVLVGIAYARATGRRYPFRQEPDANLHGTRDAPALSRIGLSRAELAQILQDFRQSANIGVEDLSRLIGAAEALAASHHAEGILAEEIMSRDLVTVGPDTPLDAVAELFRSHGFTALPVVEADQTYLGLIFQLDLLRNAAGAPPDHRADAQAVMNRALPHAEALTPATVLLDLLSRGDCDAVPVLDATGRLTGIITQTDLLATLAKRAPQD